MVNVNVVRNTLLDFVFNQSLVCDFPRNQNIRDDEPAHTRLPCFMCGHLGSIRFVKGSNLVFRCSSHNVIAMSMAAGLVSYILKKCENCSDDDLLDAVKALFESRQEAQVCFPPLTCSRNT